MDLKETKEVLQKFGKNVVSKSRSNLTRKGKNVNKRLYDSIEYDLKVGKNSFSLFFIMEEYGMYQDKGVRGANPSLVKNGVQKNPMGKFTFRNKMPPIKAISNWAKHRHIRLRDAKGRFAKGNYKTIGYLISRSIFAQGIKPSLFFTKPFTAAYKHLPDDLIEAYNLDLDDLLEYTSTQDVKYRP